MLDETLESIFDEVVRTNAGEEEFHQAVDHLMNIDDLTGLPVQRAMVLACPDERAAWAFETQFFLGPDLLVAPCLQPGGDVEVYLPAGDWQRHPDGEMLAGGRTHRLRLSLTDMAVFVRAGTGWSTDA